VSIYEWDPAKERRNIRKHGVTFHEAQTVMLDPARIERPDHVHSNGEPRLITIGRSAKDRLLTVVSSQPEGRRPRIISARRATKRERHAYERRR
jgi:uncharacterized DUF497 family protein